MKIIIKNAAPSDSRQKKWGDYHFGRCLSKYLMRLGAKVKTHYKRDWGKKDRANAVIVIRGKYPYQPKSPIVHILWVISHPGAVTLEECEAFDAVCVASHPHAEFLRNKVSVPVFPLLQCTDTEEFTNIGKKEREGVIFVGNTRGVHRPCVTWALEYGLPLKIWGRGWDQWTDPHHIVADYIPNEHLGELYAHSKFTLNDHWHDMKSLGYINNRIFDALACGLPVISDFHRELHCLFTEEILYYVDKDTFFSCVERLFTSYSNYQERTAGLAEQLRQKFSFEKRAEFIYDLIDGLRRRNKKRTFFPEIKIRKERSLDTQGKASLYSLENLVGKYHTSKDGKFCALCGSNFENFLPHGSPKRLDVLCPVCRSLENHRLLWVYFSAVLWPKLGSGTKHILHISPQLHLTRVLQRIQKLDYVSADPNSDLAMVQINPDHFKFPDDRFNIIICPKIFHKPFDTEKTIGEIFRTLIAGNGYAVMTSNGYHDYRTSLVSENSTKEIAWANEDEGCLLKFESLLTNSGFKVRIIRLYQELGPGFAQFLGLKNQIIFECFKSG